MMARLRGILAFALMVAGCRSLVVSDARTTPDAAAQLPCDPLAEPPTSLAAILGVGKDVGGTLYVADTPAGSGSQRVFVSRGGELRRQHVMGSGQGAGGGATTEYTFSIEAPESDGADARSLLVEAQGGTATAMALGPADGKAFLGGPGEAPLTVVDASAVAGLRVVDLPGTVAYVLDVANGDAIVITAPGDNQTSADFRLFYGAPGAMIERTIAAFEQARSGYPTVTFLVGADPYQMQVSVTYGPDAGPLGEPGPGTLVGAGATQSLTMRWPTPRGLSAFSFVCLGS